MNVLTVVQVNTQVSDCVDTQDAGSSWIQLRQRQTGTFSSLSSQEKKTKRHDPKVSANKKVTIFSLRVSSP